MDNINNVAKLYRGDDFEIGKIKKRALVKHRLFTLTSLV